jgi:hypothetical protein
VLETIIIVASIVALFSAAISLAFLVAALLCE